MLFCPYADVYSGHLIHRIEAPNMEEAEKIGHAWLEERNMLTTIRHNKFKYYVIQVVDQVGPRVYDVDQHKRL